MWKQSNHDLVVKPASDKLPQHEFIMLVYYERQNLKIREKCFQSDPYSNYAFWLWIRNPICRNSIRQTMDLTSSNLLHLILIWNRIKKTQITRSEGRLWCFFSFKVRWNHFFQAYWAIKIRLSSMIELLLSRG
jgi:hypothetical protein